MLQQLRKPVLQAELQRGLQLVDQVVAVAGVLRQPGAQQVRL